MPQSEVPGQPGLSRNGQALEAVTEQEQANLVLDAMAKCLVCGHLPSEHRKIPSARDNSYICYCTHFDVSGWQIGCTCRADLSGAEVWPWTS